jgi:hypothetical protein
MSERPVEVDDIPCEWGGNYVRPIFELLPDRPSDREDQDRPDLWTSRSAAYHWHAEPVGEADLDRWVRSGLWPEKEKRG